MFKYWYLVQRYEQYMIKVPKFDLDKNAITRNMTIC